MVSYCGMYPWEQHDRFDFRIVNKHTEETVAIVRKQWSYFSKDKCSNGCNYFVKFKQRDLPWNYKQLIFEAVMMVDMSHYNARCVFGMEMSVGAIIIGLVILVLIFYGILTIVTFN